MTRVLFIPIIKVLIICYPFLIGSQTTVIDRLLHNGIERNFRLYIPSSYNNSPEPVALVFNFHGFTSSAVQQEQYSEMNKIAEKYNFLVCYPNGINRAWNVGWSFGSTAKDVDFISELIDQLALKYKIDPSRVYACGMSNGGFMSFKLACELSHKIAAVASVTGSMVPQAINECKPGQAVPVLQIHGTQDFVVNYNGSNIAAPINNVLDFWKQNNKCSSSPIITNLPDINMQDNTTTEIYSYSPCDKAREVLHYKVLNGGHTWPRLNSTEASTSRDFDASEVIWNFFDQHKLDIVSAISELEQGEVGLYPNPFSDQLNISLDMASEITIVNVMGQVIHNQKYTIGLCNIETLSWPSGFYTVLVQQYTTKKQFKIVKP